MEHVTDNFHVLFDVLNAEQAIALDLPGDVGNRVGWSVEFSKKMGRTAEKVRSLIAEAWLGNSMETWAFPIPVYASLESDTGGLTAFSVQSGKVTEWGGMEISGTPEKILNDALPHEVTHALLASHFGRTIPRWADEGVAMASETLASQNEFVRPHLQQIAQDLSRPGTLDQLLRLREYPRELSDVQVMYAKSALFVRFLVDEKGKRRFLDFVGGLTQSARDISSLCAFYGFSDEREARQRLLDWIAGQTI